MSLYYSRIIFHVRETMVKTDKERQAKRREKLKAHIEAYKADLKKDKLKNTKQLNEKKNWTDQQKAAHKLKECNQVKTYRMNKAAAAEENCQDIQSTDISPYQNRQAGRGALKKLAHSLPQSPRKMRFVLAKMAKVVVLTVRDQPSCQSQKDLSDVTVKLVTDYYCKNEVSWQAPYSQIH